MRLPAAILFSCLTTYAVAWPIGYWQAKPAQIPPIVIEKTIVEERVVSIVGNVIEKNTTRQRVKPYTDRIETQLIIAAHEKAAAEVVNVPVRPAVKPATERRLPRKERKGKK